jgi:hypothetical protein
MNIAVSFIGGGGENALMAKNRNVAEVPRRQRNRDLGKRPKNAYETKKEAYVCVFLRSMSRLGFVRTTQLAPGTPPDRQ